MAHHGPSLPPVILLVLPDHWPRSLLRAELIERGYDAVGAPDLRTAFRFSSLGEPRGPVRLVVLDEAALDGDEHRVLDLVLSEHGRPPVLLLARPLREPPVAPWTRVVRRPFALGDLVAIVEEMVPLPPRRRPPS